MQKYVETYETSRVKWSVVAIFYGICSGPPRSKLCHGNPTTGSSPWGIYHRSPWESINSPSNSNWCVWRTFFHCHYRENSSSLKAHVPLLSHVLVYQRVYLPLKTQKKFRKVYGRFINAFKRRRRPRLSRVRPSDVSPWKKCTNLSGLSTAGIFASGECIMEKQFDRTYFPKTSWWFQPIRKICSHHQPSTNPSRDIKK